MKHSLLTYLLFYTAHFASWEGLFCETGGSHSSDYGDYWRVQSSGMWYRAVWQKFRDISEEYIALIFRVKASKQLLFNAEDGVGTLKHS
jgi:hypothetical protein